MTGVNNVVPWLSCYKPNPAAKLRLFCFPYAGSGALIYRNWSKSLPAHVEVCPVQLPGRGSRQHETPFIRMDHPVKATLREMRPYFHKPFAFFGHSMGAIIASDGFIHLDDDLENGDKVRINSGPFESLVGVFKRRTKDKGRVKTLLDAMNYQSHLLIDQEMVEKVN